MSKREKGPAKSTGVGGSFWNNTQYGGQHVTKGARVDHRFPDFNHNEYAVPDIKGDTAYCMRCHAIYHPKHWHLDEAEYQRISQDPEVTALVCPSCTAIEKEDFHGEVHIDLKGAEKLKDQILGTIYNEEAKSRATNPHSRIGMLHDEGDRIEIRTVNEFLADRIGKELKKAIHGSHAEIQHLERTPYTRVMWYKDEGVKKH